MKQNNKRETHSLQEERLKRQYKRLLWRWQTQAVEVSLPEVATVLVCTPRYARVLLHAMIERKWLTWASRPGRGAKGRLHCRVNEWVLDSAQPDEQTDTFVTRQIPVSTNECGTRVVIPFYRPVEKITPSDHTGRVERHLIMMVHAGLTRLNEHGIPEPDLAHTIESRNNHTVWIFHLRSGLIWHNGEHVQAEQLLLSLKYHLTRPAFLHVSSAVLEGGDAIVLTLTRSDALLAHRLANTVHALSHPCGAEIGLGAFAVRHHDDEHIILNRFTWYHGLRPLVHEVEYRIMARLPKHKWTTVTVTQPEESVEAADQIHVSSDSSGFVFLAFNERKGGLNKAQQDLIRGLARIAVSALDGVEGVQAVDSEFASAAQRQVMESDVKLPATLSLVYFWSLETEQLMKQLARQLSYWQCRLVLQPVDANHWFLTSGWENWDIGVSDLRFGKSKWFSPEERFCHSLMMQRFMPEPTLQRLMRIQESMGKNAERYPKRSRKLMRFFIDKHFLLPLFSFSFQVKSTPQIRGVEVTSQGWPDLTRLWVQGK